MITFLDIKLKWLKNYNVKFFPTFLGTSTYPPRALRLRTEVQNHNDPSRPLRVTVVSDAVAFNWRIPYVRCDALKCDFVR